MKGESRRQWIERNLHDSEVGIVLDVAQCLLSFVMVIAMTKLNWNNPDTAFTTEYLVIDTINLVATLINLGLRFYSASNRKSFLLHWLSVVEIICVLPLLVEFITGSTDTKPNTYAFRLLMMLRVMRLLQFYRLLRLAKSAKLRQGLLICLTTSCVIICAAMFMQSIEYCDPAYKGTQVSGENCQDMTFLDAIYFVCITITTVGFGDVAPKSSIGKAFDVGLIFFAGSLIPLQISGYSYILSRETAFDKKYIPDRNEERRTRRKVVILAPTLPSNDLRRVLLHPDYEQRVIYLQGSAMVAADLQRAAAPSAEFCFVMVKKHSDTLDQNDTAANLITCSVRKNNRHAPLHVQVSKFDNTRHFHISGATAVICLEQLKLAFFGKCLWIRGLNPFLGNLIQKFSHAEECRGYWLSDYLSGNYEDFLANLSDFNEKVSGIVFITQRTLTEKDFMAHQLHDRLYFVRGSPLSMHVFHTARMFHARSILIMSYCGMESTSSTDVENDQENMDENMADVDAITTHRFISEALQNELSRLQINGINETRPIPFIVAEMIRPSNVKFLIDRSGSLYDEKVAANESRQRDLLKEVKFIDSSFFSPLYTSGHIYFSNFMDALMGSCSNQQLMIEMVTQLVISGNMSMKMPNRVQRSRHRLTQIPAPERYHFRPYALLVEGLLHESIMTLGIYRSASTRTSPQFVNVRDARIDITTNGQ
ncbi:Voltage-gated Ion Channel (VIC) Superfamily [Phytophthora cinnamomi]|uniref:Voltage-gated Ion Channel (VIC) Superfamily n=1 Tax=Phytophthora cinnamomi TaxID=4785 RepID=UPI0035595230|nr:Voltage-gated Ion Channel (VIC) Superfamily [Phytophthora cinnamomi]